MKKFSKLVLGASFALLTVAPALANMTDLTIQADVNPMLAIQLESVNQANKIVSADNNDPQPGSPAANEVINFGTVTALGLVTQAYTDNNALTSVNPVKAMVTDTAGLLYKSDATGVNPLPTTTNDGAVYFLQNALLIRTFKTGASSNALVEVQNDSLSTLTGFVEPTATHTFADNTSFLPAAYQAPNSAKKTLAAANPNGTAIPIDVGVKIPLSAVGNGLFAKFVFTAT